MSVWFSIFELVQGFLVLFVYREQLAKAINRACSVLEKLSNRRFGRGFDILNSPRDQIGNKIDATYMSRTADNYQALIGGVKHELTSRPNQLDFSPIDASSIHVSFFGQKLQSLVEDYSIFCVSIIWMFCSASDA